MSLTCRWTTLPQVVPITSVVYSSFYMHVRLHNVMKHCMYRGEPCLPRSSRNALSSINRLIASSPCEKILVLAAWHAVGVRTTGPAPRCLDKIKESDEPLHALHF